MCINTQTVKMKEFFLNAGLLDNITFISQSSSSKKKFKHIFFMHDDNNNDDDENGVELFSI